MNENKICLQHNDYTKSENKLMIKYFLEKLFPFSPRPSGKFTVKLVPFLL